MLNVRVRPLSVKGDRVVYSWKQSIPNRFMYRSRFFFEYPGLDLATFDDAVHWNTFLGVMIPFFRLFEEPVSIELPSFVPPRLIEFWLLFHDALDTEFKLPPERHGRSDGEWTTVTCPTRSPWHERICKHVSAETGGSQDRPTSERPSGRKAAILFGGGKDSTFSLGVLSELLGEENVTLLGYINPMRSSRLYRRRIEQLRQRRATNLIRPIRAVSEVDSFDVSSNFSSNCRDKVASYASHIALYTAPCLPFVLSKGINHLVFNYEICQYYTHEAVDGLPVPKFYFRRSRPEYNRATSKLYNELFGTDLEISNLSYPISEFITFNTVLRRYPKLAPSMMTCGATMDASTRWCHQCKKCFEFALGCLNARHLDPRFDYDGCLERGRHAEGARAYLASTQSREWNVSLCHAAHFQSFRHLLHGMDADFLARALSKPSLELVLALKQRYGAAPVPITERYAAQAMEFIPAELRQGYERIVGEYFEAEPRVEGYEYGNTRVDFRFDEKVELELG